jgi:integrase
LVIGTCIATAVRISEVLGLKWRNVNLNAGTIKIERVWHQDLDRANPENTRGVLGIGDLAERYIGRKLAEDAVGSDTFVFSAEAGAWTAGLGFGCS